MGMFDWVNLHESIELPNFPEDGDRDFQTKDFACTLGEYKINEDGRLLRKRYADVRKNNQSPPSRSLISIFRDGKDWDDMDFEGYLEIYSFDGLYNLYFEDGALEDIELVKQYNNEELNSDG